jgi:intracellular sulfur oxidation DsrE/DsrF family protein
MEKAEGHAISVLPDATVVPSGMVHLMELQEQGWGTFAPDGARLVRHISPL